MRRQWLLLGVVFASLLLFGCTQPSAPAITPSPTPTQFAAATPSQSPTPTPSPSPEITPMPSPTPTPAGLENAEQVISESLKAIDQKGMGSEAFEQVVFVKDDIFTVDDVIAGTAITPQSVIFSCVDLDFCSQNPIRVGNCTGERTGEPIGCVSAVSTVNGSVATCLGPDQNYCVCVGRPENFNTVADACIAECGLG